MDNTNKLYKTNDLNNDSSIGEQIPFFCNEGVLNTDTNNSKPLSVEQKRWLILEFIKSHPVCTIYAVAKGTNTNYSQAHQIMRELVFCRLLVTEKIQGENGEFYDGFSIPESANKNEVKA
jgi:predicted transcriptional regulator